MLLFLLLVGAPTFQPLVETGVVVGSATSSVEFRLIVHADNPVEALPREEVAKMFRRQTVRWRDWPGEPRVEPVDQKVNSPVRVSFTRSVHGWSPQRLQTFWQRKIFAGRGVPPLIRETDGEVVDFVGQHLGGIGYVLADTRLSDRVKELRLLD